MNREIKFRAWDKLKKEFIDFNKIGFLEDGSMWYLQGLDEYENEIDPPYFEDDDTWVLLQFTGLKDKNGVEIYEYSELDSAYEVIFKDLKYNLRHIPNNDIIDLHDYWRDKNGEIEVTREYTKV